MPRREPTVLEQQCIQCNLVKPAKDFDKNGSGLNGLRRACKACMKVQMLLLDHTAAHASRTSCALSRTAHTDSHVPGRNLSGASSSVWGHIMRHTHCHSTSLASFARGDVEKHSRRACAHSLSYAVVAFRYDCVRAAACSDIPLSCMVSAQLMRPQPMVSEQECTRCHLTKPASDFYYVPTAAKGLKKQCKACMLVRLPCHGTTHAALRSVDWHSN